MTFRNRLLVGQLLSLVLITTTAFVAIAALHLVTAGEGRIARELAEKLTRVQQVRLDADKIVAVTRAYLLTGERRYQSDFAAATAEIEGHLFELRVQPLDGEGKRNAASVARTATAYMDAARVAVRERSNTHDASSVVPFFDATLKPRRDELEASVAAFAHHERETFEDALGGQQVRARDAQIQVLVASTLATVIGLGLGWIVVRRMSSQFEQMREAQTVASVAADAREEMLAIVSHDLRNPLSAIAFGAELLDETTSDDRARRLVRTIRTAAGRMTHMIDELLEAAGIEANTLVLHCEPCAPKRMIDETLELFRARAADREVALRADSIDALVVGDRERIVEVLSNLIGNALKFTPRGGEIVVTAEPRETSVRFVVSDTGPGVASDVIPHLFDRYWQRDRSHARDGLGLGLYICKKLVEAHHGSIGVDSVIGHGSAFWFTVPSAQRTGAESQSSVPS